MKISEIAKGQTFHCFSGDHEMIRQTGEIVDVPNRNQWGRIEPGTHKELKCVVRTNRGPYRGWTPPHYALFYLWQEATVYDDKCPLKSCEWRYPKG